MNRRAFVAGIAVVAAAPMAATAQQAKWRIGCLIPGTPSAYQSRIAAFMNGLREHGLVEGQNVTLEFRWVEDDSVASCLASELIRLGVDVIVTAGTPLALATKEATSSLPIVVAAAGDFLGTHLVTDLGRPGGNVTGTSDLTVELSGKRLELLKEVDPRISRIAVFWAATNPGAARSLRELQAAAPALKIPILSVEIRSIGDIDSAFERARTAKVDGTVIVQDPFMLLHRKRIIELAAHHRLPAIYGSATFVEEGGLVSYGADIPDLYRRAAGFVDKILKGAKPGDLPIEQPTKFQLVINLRAAKAIHLTVPKAILVRADQVIQ